MTLKHQFKRVFKARKVIPKYLWDILKDLDERIENNSSSEIISTEVNISTGNASGSSTPNDELIGANVIGIVPNGNQDQFIKEIIIGEDGKVTVTLNDNAISQNKFIIFLAKINSSE